MFSKLKEAANGARLRAGQMWRERKERAEEQRASEPAGVTVPAWLVRAAKFASWVATISLMYFLWLYTLDIARDRSADMHITRAGTWTGEIQFWFPYVFGFAIVAFGIPYVAKIAIPTFMSLSWRGNFWPKLWALIIALSVSLVVIAGTFAVQGDQLMERDREAAVAVEGVQQERAAIEAQIAGITDDLRSSTEGSSTQAQAARVGMLAGSVEAAREQWTNSYVLPAERARDPNTERIRRATGSAEAAAAAVARREALRQQLATTTTVAAVQSEVVTERTGWIADTLGWLEGVRAILLSLVMDVVALMMPWIALRLEQARNRQLGMAEGIPRHRFMLNDLTENAPPASVPSPLSREEFEKRKAPMDSGYQGDTIYDERGNELLWVEGFVRPKDGKWIPGHYRKSGKRKKQEIEVEIGGKMFTTSGIDHETGVDRDGGARIASVAQPDSFAENIEADAIAASQPVQDNAPANPVADGEGAEQHDSHQGVQNKQDEPSTDPAPLETLSEEELTELLALESAAADVNSGADERDGADGSEKQEQVMEQAGDEPVAAEPEPQTEPSREPETNPNRLIAAE